MGWRSKYLQLQNFTMPCCCVQCLKRAFLSWWWTALNIFCHINFSAVINIYFMWNDWIIGIYMQQSLCWSHGCSAVVVQIKELKRHLFATSLKDLQLNEVGRSNYTFKTVGAAFWAFKQKDFRLAIQNIVMEVWENNVLKMKDMMEEVWGDILWTCRSMMQSGQYGDVVSDM